MATSGFSYALNGKRRAGQPFVDFQLIIQENNAWQSIQLSYIFSGRTDLTVGNFLVDYYWWKKLSNGVFQVTHDIERVLPANVEYDIAIFISGFSTADNKFVVSINQPWFQLSVKQLGVIFNYKSKPDFTSITFSYVIFPRTHPVLKMVYDPTPSAQQGSYQLTGPVDFTQNQRLVYNEWRVVNRNIPCNGEKCGGRNGCILLEECNNQFGYFWQGQCYFCPAGILFDNGRCLSRCGANQIYFNRVCYCQTGFTRVGVDCILEKNCGTNEIWSDSLNKCVCKLNSMLWNGECRVCPANSFPNPAQTWCDCVDQGKKFNELTNSCESKCNARQVWKTDQCACIQQYSWWNQDCRECPSDSTPNTAQTTCLCTDPFKIYDADTNTCKACGLNFVPDATKTGCICRSGYVLDAQDQCVPAKPICTAVEIYNPTTNACDCIPGYQRLGPGPCINRCAANEEWTGSICICKAGFARFNGQPCRACPTGTTPNQERDKCLCNDPNSIFLPNSLVCQICPINSAPKADDTECVCNAGWTKNGPNCVSQCQSNASPDHYGACKCNNGYYLDDKVCKVQPVCPPGAQWNQAALACVCDADKTYLIGGVCKQCGTNEGWNGVECVCKANFFRINGNCVTCDPRSSYNGKECVCQLGTFGNGLTCTSCDITCSKCTGPGANQCTQCRDISLTLLDGFCSTRGPCNPGYYLDGSSCSRCSENCAACTNPFECSTCIDGFEPITLPLGAQTVVSCSEKCGDGKRFTAECDDGNLINGDGCNDYCEIEDGWTCNGGGSTKRDNCVQSIPSNVILSKTGATNLGTIIIQQVRASYLPPCVSKFECADCAKVLDVAVVSSLAAPEIRVNYNPFTKYQWVIKATFNEIVSSSIKLVVKINPIYKGQGANCFADSDFNQQLEILIDDPRDLILDASVGALNSIP